MADNAFLAKLAVYSRQRAMMKDMPVALLLALSKRDPALFRKVFDRVVDNGRTLRTLVQFVRSGQFGRKGLSYSLQRAVQRWLNSASVEKLLSASIGNDPSLRDVLRLARPTPPDNARRALFGWLTDKPVEKWAPATEADLPEEVMALAAFRKAESAEAQILILGNLHARWDLLADTAKGPAVWAAIARKMGPQALRMNLNTLVRHGVIGPDANREMVDYVAARLADPDEIRRSRQFPYQFLAAYMNAGDEVPQKIKAALHKAAEIACGNVPELPGPVVIGLDVSGSMGSPVTGNRGRGCHEQDALRGRGGLVRRRHPAAQPGQRGHPVRHGGLRGQGGSDRLGPQPGRAAGQVRWRRHELLAAAGGGQRPVRQPEVRRLRAGERPGELGRHGRNGSTAVMTEWQTFVRNQVRLHGKAYFAGPKLVCIDLQPYTTTQAPERSDILNVGGFSDAVFSVVAAFLADDSGRFVAEVEKVEL